MIPVIPLYSPWFPHVSFVSKTQKSQNTYPQNYPCVFHSIIISPVLSPVFPKYTYIYIYVYICNQSFLMMSSFVPLSLSHCPHLTLAQRHVAPAQIRRCWRNVRGYLAPAPHSPASPGHLGFSKRGDQVIYQAPSKKNIEKDALSWKIPILK